MVYRCRRRFYTRTRVTNNNTDRVQYYIVNEPSDTRGVLSVSIVLGLFPFGWVDYNFFVQYAVHFRRSQERACGHFDVYDREFIVGRIILYIYIFRRTMNTIRARFYYRRQYYNIIIARYPTAVIAALYILAPWYCRT